MYMNTSEVVANNAYTEGFLKRHTSLSGLIPFVSRERSGAFGLKCKPDLGLPGELSFALTMLMAAASRGHHEP